MKNPYTSLILYLCLLLRLPLTVAADAAEIHVQPDGPIRTLAEAQVEARKTKGSVIVHGGTYYLEQPLVFTAADSGTSYVAAPGEKPVISGGVKLNLQWQPYKDGIMQAKVPTGVTFDQLFVNGKQQPLARYPNYDPKATVFHGYAADAFNPERVSRWADPTGGFMHAIQGPRWGSYHFVIKGKDASGHLIYEGGWQLNRTGDLNKDYRFVENIFEELDAPGEWYLNTKTSTLYYYPAPGINPTTATFEGAGIRTLVDFEGSEQQPVKNVTLKGLTFEHSARTFMDTRVPLLRSDWTIARAGALLVTGTENCTIEDCTVHEVGGNAIFVNMYNRHLTIQGCHIHDIGASGVCFVGDTHAQRNARFQAPRSGKNNGPLAEEIKAAGGDGQAKLGTDAMDRTPGPLTANYPADCLVSDCLIHDTGGVEKQTAGVTIDLAQRITVSHCSIYGSTRSGINIGCGSWGGNVIEYCDVFDTVLETRDHGAFNSWGRDRWFAFSGGDWANTMKAKWPELPFADTVEPNTIRNSRWKCDYGWDIDLDDASSNYRISNNVCLNGGIKIPDGYRRTVENNILVNSSLTAHKWFNNDSENIFRHNIVFAPYKTGVGFTKGLPGRDVDNNLLHQPGQAPAPASALQQASGLDQHSLSGDAMFVDPSKGDYTVKSDSPALKLGFKNIPMDQFGVQKPELKAIAKTPVIPIPGIKSAAESKGKSRIGLDTTAWMGATVSNLQGDDYSFYGIAENAGGVILKGVQDGSPLAKTGLKTDDLIQSVNGKGVRTVKDFLKVASEVPLKLRIVRDQGRKEVTVTDAK